MKITMGLIMSRLIAYGHELIHAYGLDKDMTLEKSYVHGLVSLDINCNQSSIRCADIIAAGVLWRSNSEFRFTMLKIYLRRGGNELGVFEFDGDKVVFRTTVFGTRPDSLLTDELHCNKVEEVLKMKEPETLKFETGVLLMAAPMPTIEKIHINGPCTVIIWSDKTKTMVRLQDCEAYDEEKAVYAAIAKKFIGTNKSKSNWLDIIRKKMPDESFYCKNDIEKVKQLLNSIYGIRKDEIEELRKSFGEEYNDTTETNGLTDSEPDVYTDDSVSGD